MSTTTETPMAATKVVTGKVRFSYLTVWEAKAMTNDATPKYSVSLIIPKSDTKTVNAVKKAIEAAKQQGKDTVFKGKIPTASTFWNPLRDGDTEKPDDDAYTDAYFVTAKASTKPGLVKGKNCDPIMNQDELYSGCFGHASVNFYAFDKAGQKGIACGLNNLLKISDGDPLGGRASAESDFAELTIEEDNDDFLG